MTAKDLKNALLQEAVQGKLVPQIASEGNAKYVLEEIRKEKAKLVKEGKLKKEKPLPEITEEDIPFDIPENWCWCRLGEIVSILGDGIHGTPNYDISGNYYFVNGNNLNDGKIEIKSDTKKVNQSEYEKYKKELNKNTVFVSINGTLGNVAFYENENIILGKSACYFNLIKNEMKKFIYWLIKTKYFLDYANQEATGTTIKNVSLAAMRNFPLPLPPLAEQKRIVAAIEKFMPLIEEYGKKETELKTFNEQIGALTKKAILQEAVQGKLVPQIAAEGNASDLLEEIRKEKLSHGFANSYGICDGKNKKTKSSDLRSKSQICVIKKELPEITEDEIPFDIPESWCWCRLGEIVQLTSGQDLQPEMYNSSQKGIPYITGASNFNNGNVIINRWTETPKSVAIKDDLLLTCKGTVGEMAFLKEKKVHIARQVMSVRSSEKISLGYVKIYLTTQIENLKSKAKSMIPGIAREDVISLLIPLPPFAEQKRIVEAIENLLPLCEALKI